MSLNLAFFEVVFHFCVAYIGSIGEMIRIIYLDSWEFELTIDV